MNIKKMENIIKKILEKKYATSLTTPASFFSSKVLYNKTLRDLFEVTEDFAHEAFHFKCTGSYLLPNVGFRSVCLHGSEKETYGRILSKSFQYTPNDILITYIVFLSIVHFISKEPAYNFTQLTTPNVKMPSDVFMISKIHQQAFVYKAMSNFIQELAADSRVVTTDSARLFSPLRFGRVQLVDELQYGVHYLIRERNVQDKCLHDLERSKQPNKRSYKLLAQSTYPTIAEENHFLCSKRLPSLFLISCLHFTDPIYNNTATPLSILDGFWFTVNQENDLVNKINSLENCDFGAWLTAGLYFVNNKDAVRAKKALYNMHRVMLPLKSRIQGYKWLMLESACNDSPYRHTSQNSISTGRKGLSLFLDKENEIMEMKTQKGYPKQEPKKQNEELEVLKEFLSYCDSQNLIPDDDLYKKYIDGSLEEVVEEDGDWDEFKKGFSWRQT